MIDLLSGHLAVTSVDFILAVLAKTKDFSALYRVDSLKTFVGVLHNLAQQLLHGWQKTLLDVDCGIKLGLIQESLTFSHCQTVSVVFQEVV